jgi:uncharacterized membrane protein YdjX (TVP38/TMEM64 family)
MTEITPNLSYGIARRLKYPKFMLLALTFLAAYALFGARDLSLFRETLAYLGYAGSFLCGVAYVYGFTAGPSTAVLLVLSKQQNIILAALIGGAGALIGDLIIFRFVRHSLRDEVERLSASAAVRHINERMPLLLKKHLLPVLAVFVIASPLPDEIGVSMFAALTKIRMNTFLAVSYALNTLGIFAVLLIGSML